MPWLPAISLLALGNAILLIGIALAPMVRRRGLRRWRWHQSRIAARVHAELESGNSGSRLVTLLQDRDEAVVMEALRAIGRAPAQHSRHLIVLAGLVRDSAPRVRVFASWACLRILSACPERQVDLRTDPAPEIRALVAAADCLAQVAYPPLMPLQVHRLSDPSTEVRLAAARFIGLHCGVGDVGALCQMLSGMDQQVSRRLLASLSRRDRTASGEVLAIAGDTHAHDRVSAIRLLGTSADPAARRALMTLLADLDPGIRRESVAAAASSARIGYPRPLESALVDRLLHLLAEDPVQAIVAEAIDALAYSMDPRVPAAFLRRIPSSRGSVRERLVESGALFAHIVQSAERRRAGEGG